MSNYEFMYKADEPVRENEREMMTASERVSERESVGEGSAFDPENIKENPKLEPELMKIKGRDELGELKVYGNPYQISKELDGHQGDNLYKVKGNSGIVAVLNVIRMAGMKCSENQIVKRAIDMDCCTHSYYNEAYMNGKTDRGERCKLLESYGIDCNMTELIYEDNLVGYLNSIANYVEEGRGVIMDMNSGLLHDYDNVAYRDYAVYYVPNLSVAVTGTARNPETGFLEGLFICDSSNGNKSMFVSLDELILANMHMDSIGKDSASYIVTTKPIR